MHRVASLELVKYSKHELLTIIVSNSNYWMILEILGLKSDSSDKDIKHAYFKLAKKYHPDLNAEITAREMFDKVSK